MNSMTVVKKGLGKSLAAMALAAAVLAVPAKADVSVGGTVPITNDFMAFGNTALDIQSVGAAKVMATVFVNNNTAGGWTLTATILNGGFLNAGIASPGVQGQNLQSFTALPTMILSTVNQGTLGGALVPTAFSGFVAGSSGSTTSGAQTVATKNYGIDITGTWVAVTTLLAGTYRESITLALTCAL